MWKYIQNNKMYINIYQIIFEKNWFKLHPEAEIKKIKYQYFLKKLAL